MARPQLDPQERWARTVGVRVTAAEAAELRERAQAARLSMGAYLRRRALGQRVRMAAELRMGAEELRELNRIGGESAILEGSPEESNGAGAQLESRVVAGRDPGGGRAGRGAGG